MVGDTGFEPLRPRFQVAPGTVGKTPIIYCSSSLNASCIYGILRKAEETGLRFSPPIHPQELTSRRRAGHPYGSKSKTYIR